MNKFYICPHCGNLIGKIHDSGAALVCCGQKMQALIPNTTEASGEKHIPVVKVEGTTLHINIGSVDHPMVPEHFIEWVYVETAHGGVRRALKPSDDPHVVVELGDEKPLAVYAWCNIHGLWMTEL